MTEKRNIRHVSTPPLRLYEPIPNDAVTADELVERWLWLANPVWPQPSIILFNPTNRDASVANVKDLYNKYGVVLTDGWTGE